VPGTRDDDIKSVRHIHSRHSKSTTQQFLLQNRAAARTLRSPSKEAASGTSRLIAG
jgi:hypothetical protein